MEIASLVLGLGLALFFTNIPAGLSAEGVWTIRGRAMTMGGTGLIEQKFVELSRGKGTNGPA